MDIWNWLTKLQDDLQESGHGASAEAIERLTDLVVDLEIERAEALLPEIKALAKTLDNPWLDVWAGHWEMRNRVGNRMEGETALADVVALFELAHREDAKDCPQSICATQDLSACYANIDGPGSVAERIEVCEETLARIDPTWACFNCLSCEKAEAMIDDGQPESALAWLDAQEKLIVDAGEEAGPAFDEIRIEALIRLQQNEEALRLIEQAQTAADDYGYDPAQWSQPRQILKGLALAQLGRDDEAREALPPWDELAPTYRMNWLRAMALLLQRQPTGNTWQFGRQVQQTLEHNARVGAHRSVIDTAELGIRLALERGSPWSARRQLELAQRHLPKLRQDRGASAQLAALAEHITAAAAPQPLPAPAEELLDWLDKRGEEQGQSRDPEQEVQWLLQAVAQCPDDMALRSMAASALRACAAVDEAIALLWEDVRAHPGEERRIIYDLLHILLDAGRIDEVRRLAGLFRDSVPVAALWCEIKCAEKLGDWPEVERLCRDLLARSPNSHGARQALVRALMEQAHFAEAAREIQPLIEHRENSNAPLWDHMTAAAAAGDWAAVRQSAQALEMKLDGDEGPIEEDWGWVIIRYQEDGEARDYYARRTGPVTARIQEPSPGNWPQHVDDWIVFDAAPLYPPPEDEEERKDFTATYRFVHRLEAGGFAPSWAVDGVAPDDETFNAFRDRVVEQGWRIWIRSNDQYRLSDAESGAEDLPGIYFLVAQPKGEAPQALHDFLETACRDWPHRWCWLRLAEACGQPAQPHWDLIERYGL